MNILTFESITFRYTLKKPPILKQFSWEVPTGRTVLLGPNGAGKSTLLALGANALRPSQGVITMNGLDPGKRLQRKAFRQQVGWMPQHIQAVPGLTTSQQVAYAGWLKGLAVAQAETAAIRALAATGLAQHGDQPAATLSGGQLRRLGLAQVLVHDPALLLLDEPTVGLDPAQRARFRELLTALPPQQPVLVSTHQVDDLSDLFDTVVLLHNGHIKFQGSVAEFLGHGAQAAGSYRAEQAYAALTGEED